MTASRLAMGLPVAAGVTAALFLLMRTLILVEPGAMPEETPRLTFDINPEVKIVEPDGPTPDEIEMLDPPPPIPEVPVDPTPRPDGELTDFIGELPRLDPPVIETQNTNFTVDGDARPVIRIEPVYPNSALQRGIEGDCVMSFDVGTDGVPLNVRADCTSAVFTSASVRAVERWRYDPMVVNGEPRVRSNLQTRLNFELND
ncbi:energy transducer TonB [Hyphobacterium marinum]|uniref:Energy transducer TonB n=1 Tax=Hyphobacterium marinum TaxID=3116574 RepID=A0ABU7M1T8_9PROT|nr:energy transducer TonB [Hyphobacterium sp. Y6023]MEE2567370.1 energy transducer TonB [Hyphobacterium sp. Y6023]